MIHLLGIQGTGDKGYKRNIFFLRLWPKNFFFEAGCCRKKHFKYAPSFQSNQRCWWNLQALCNCRLKSLLWRKMSWSSYWFRASGLPLSPFYVHCRSLNKITNITIFHPANHTKGGNWGLKTSEMKMQSNNSMKKDMFLQVFHSNVRSIRFLLSSSCNKQHLVPRNRIPMNSRLHWMRYIQPP